MGRCISHVSQQDADLCAQRNAVICMNNNGGPGRDNGDTDKPKPTIGNDPQVCTEPNTGRTVIVPADVFFAETKEEANAIALSYANKLQLDGGQPPGLNIVPTPTTDGGPWIPPGPFPTPTQPRKKPTPGPDPNRCEPCDDSAAIDTFVVAANLPAGVTYQVWESDRPLKCGEWKFEVTGGPYDPSEPPGFIVLDVVAGDPSRSMLSWNAFMDCPQPYWQMPCGNGATCEPWDTGQFGLTGCCDTTSVNCKFASCVTIGDGTNWLMVARVYYTCVVGEGVVPPARNFTVTGTWLGPLPSSS